MIARRGHAAYLLHKLLSSFWFVPGAMAVAGFAAAAGALGLDAAGASELLKPLGPPFDIGEDVAGKLLSTLAGAMVTVVSLVFSLTLVTLTVAAGNLGARLLERYMQNTVTQVTMGLFVGGFVFTVVVLSAVGSAPVEVPRLSVVLALLLAIFSVAWLMYAFHDLARSLQIDQAAAAIAGSLRQRIGAVAAVRQAAPADPGELPSDRPCCRVRAGACGYVEAIDWEALGAVARSGALVLDVTVAQGDYLTPVDPLLTVYGVGEADADRARALRAAFTVGELRTDADDLMFLVHLLIEIAARALSPGINDVYTALACADHLTGSIARALECRLDRITLRDDDGRLRVRTRSADAVRMVDTVFPALRRNGMHNVTFALRLIASVERLAPLAAGHPAAAALLRNLDEIADHAATGVHAIDRAAIESARARAREAFGRSGAVEN